MRRYGAGTAGRSSGRKLCFAEETFGRRVPGTEDILGENGCMSKIIERAWRIWDGVWATLFLAGDTGVRGIFTLN